MGQNVDSSNRCRIGHIGSRQPRPLIARLADAFCVDDAVVARCIEVYQPRLATKTVAFVEAASGGVFGLARRINIDSPAAGGRDLSLDGLH